MGYLDTLKNESGLVLAILFAIAVLAANGTLPVQN